MIPGCRFFSFVLVVIILTSAPARAQHFEDILRPELVGKTVVLRDFYRGDRLRFDSQGSPVGKAEPGFWSSDGIVLIEKVSSEKNKKLVLKARRIISEFDPKVGKFTNFETNDEIRIEVELNPNWRDAAPAQLLVKKIFATGLEDVRTTIPEYWHCPLFGSLKRDERDKWKCTLPEKIAADVAGVPQIVDLGESGPKQEDADTPKEPKFVESKGVRVYKVGNGVTPPRPTHSPDPMYTNTAKNARFEGTSILKIIIDDTGSIGAVDIERPLGGGLDDAAVNAVQGWKFTPAKLNDNPVAV